MQHTTAVILTYGDRFAYLKRSIECATYAGIKRLVVVDNGASENSKRGLEALKAQHGNFIHIAQLDNNLGSAGGYRKGLEYALGLPDTEYIWLLDDDNGPEPDCLEHLFKAYKAMSPSYTVDKLVVYAYRPESEPQRRALQRGQGVQPRESSFLGFHVSDIPQKLKKRLKPKQNRAAQGKQHQLISCREAPFSGLLFHRAVPDSIGLPREDFVLYCDDTEFTLRLTQAGGCIMLVPDAVQKDLEPSPTLQPSYSNVFSTLLKSEGDFRFYYSTRNRTYIDAHLLAHNPYILWLNRKVFTTILVVAAWILRRRDRYHILMEAIEDGFSGNLGMNKKYPL